MGIPIGPKKQLEFAKNQVRRSLVGGMMAGESAGTALKNAVINGADPFEYQLNRKNRHNLPDWGDPTKEARKAKEAREQKRKERFARYGVGMKKGGQVKASKKPSGVYKAPKKQADCCRGMGAATRGGKFNRNG